MNCMILTRTRQLGNISECGRSSDYVGSGLPNSTHTPLRYTIYLLVHCVKKRTSQWHMHSLIALAPPAYSQNGYQTMAHAPSLPATCWCTSFLVQPEGIKACNLPSDTRILQCMAYYYQHSSTLLHQKMILLSALTCSCRRAGFLKILSRTRGKYLLHFNYVNYAI